MKDQAALLSAQSRYDLADLCMRMGLEPAPESESKTVTARRIAEAMEAHPEIVRQCFGLGCLDALKEIVDSRSGELTLPLTRRDKTGELLDALELLQHFGLAWRDRRLWHLSGQVRELVAWSAEEDRELEINDILLGQLEVALNRYGTAPVRVVLGLDGHDDSPEAALRLATLTLYSRFNGLSGFCPGTDGTLWLRSRDCENFPATLLAQLAFQKGGLDWSEGGLDSVFTFEDCCVPLTEKGMNLLRELLAQLSGPDPDLVAECIEDAFFFLQDGDRESALEALCDFLTEEERTPARRWLMDRLLNQFPVWALMGHSISEVSTTALPRELRRAPGDPCPCGSGRPWSRCHGRLN